MSVNERKQKEGMLLDIYRPADGSDCTNGGLSSIQRGHTGILLVGKGRTWSVPEVFSAARSCKGTTDRPIFRLVERSIGGKPYFHAEPADNPEGKHWMFGGNFAFTSDSRIREIAGGPIPLHDRSEVMR